ncbi:beta-galactosidase-1-like protein 2 [Diabrotica virgifera virgifera]|uniref:Beta-galactosidase n=1 Tax=Diabrotica virgifera virgifera TaxID=50390 RepID=A0ABM5K7Q2_DIAVI|nr:beta-galactosidase-1-like protein 2 [Diabrotica virgifera virgifera]
MADKVSKSDKIPTLYEYFTDGGIQSGLNDKKTHFTLNGKEITIFSGALHYFRVPRDYWKDRLRKYRAAGLNTVETYVPWNLHEYEDGVYDFGNGGSDFQDFLDLDLFIKLAKEEDLFVILRPGPYICAEWDFGGLPSWLLRYEGIKIRTSDAKYVNLVKRYFKKLLRIVAPLQFTKGGPIIAVQIENEYGNLEDGSNNIDAKHLEQLKDILQENGIIELLFTSDTPSNGFAGTVPGVLATANFQHEPEKELTLLKNFQPDKPLMVMEYWTGWFDHWAERHHTRTADNFGEVLDGILNFGASVNFYMFHGGTNWGFLNGANLKNKSVTATDNGSFQPDITSYDYDAPLSEAGDYTDKYYKAKEIIAKYSKLKIKIPAMPELHKRMSYAPIDIIGELTLADIINQSQVHHIERLVSMELIDVNNKSGQSYGYIVYRATGINIPKNSILQIEGRINDTVLVLINGQLMNPTLKSKADLDGFGYWRAKNSCLNLENEEYNNASVELVVENWGRVNYGFLEQFNQHKGICQGNILINNDIIQFNEAVPLQFKKSCITKLNNWQKPSFTKGPKLYKAILNIDEPRDTYIDMRDWIKGFIIINNFVLARYLRLGPQQSAYLPAPLLKKGQNEILVFEHFCPSNTVKFVEDLIFEEAK